MTGIPPAGAVEFVCTGNICRSPFAAGVALAEGLAPDRVRSSGLWAEPGRACPHHAVAVAAEFGVDLASHRARRTDRSELLARDWVLAMEFGQLGEVQRMLGSAWGGRAGLLGRFAPGAGVDIPDPYGGSPAEYRAAYGSIREAVRGWLAGPGDCR